MKGLMFDSKKSDAETAKAMNDPQPGDRFTEMYAFYVYVLECEGNQVTFMECNPPCDVPKDGKVGTISLSLWRKRYAYGSIPGYSVRLCERGNDVSGWAKHAQHRLHVDAATPSQPGAVCPHCGKPIPITAPASPSQ